MHLRRRSISQEQMRKFEGDVAAIFEAFGLDLHTPATERTPQRFLQAMFDATEGYEGDPKLLTAFQTECRGGPDCRLSQVIEGPIHFFSLCEHHALPFHGHAYVGYIAHEHIIGISKLTRLVRLFAKRFGSRSPIPWKRCLRRTALPSISKPITSVPRCAESAKSRPSPAPPSGAVSTRATRPCGASSSTCVGCAHECPRTAGVALRYGTTRV